MSRMYNLTDAQRELVVANTGIVEQVIHFYINTNNRVSGLGYDDIYQEGCVALCRAAATYDGSVLFKTYAQVVVRNALYSYCSKMAAEYRRTLSYDAPLNSDSYATFADVIPDEYGVEPQLSLADTLKLLDSVKAEYRGVTLKGIEALELKMKGFSGKEIASMYGVKQTHVGAWITRAAQKLRVNDRFINAVE